METRTITEEEIASCQAICTAAFDDLYTRRGLEEDAGDADWLRPILQHFLATDPDGARIAINDNEPVAFASTFRRGSYWFLSFMFVLPKAQGKGIARRLLTELSPQGDGIVRATVVESFQPASTGLYASFGIVPQTIKYWLSELSRPEALPGLPSDLRKSEVTNADLSGIDTLDRSLLGFERPQDHQWWTEKGMARWIYRRGDDLVAYAYVDEEYVGPVLAIDEATLAFVVADIVGSSKNPASMTVNVSGNSADVFQMLAGAGARIDDSTSYRLVYCSDAGPLPRSYIHHSDWLP